MNPKLVIWDLDDTLWQGTLAEGDNLQLFDDRVDMIRLLNERGVVNAICSKNNFDHAKKTLQEKKLWDLFVFPEISFEPKGALVKRIIKNMQLRAPDVVFIDDNPHNLQEVSYENDGIITLDAREPDTNTSLLTVLETYKDIRKNRVEEYRILEKKHQDAKSLGITSNQKFLETCGIKIAIVERTDNLPFAARIEELINRTNQMNFTQSRVEDNSMAEYIIQSTKHDTYSVFVWDKYGYYGLVGFASVKQKKLEHMTFSCRIMNMGIENALARYIRENHPFIEIPAQAVPKETPWIEHVKCDDAAFQTHLANTDETSENAPTAKIRLMLNCQSGAIAHYMGLPDVTWDNYPRVYTLMNNADEPDYRFPTISVYGAFLDYNHNISDKKAMLEKYTDCIENYIRSIPEDGMSLIVLPPENFKGNGAPGAAASADQYKILNDLWRDAESRCSRIRTLNIFEFEPSPDLIKDPRHFSPQVLHHLAQRIKKIIVDFQTNGTLPSSDSAQRQVASFKNAQIKTPPNGRWKAFAEPNVQLIDCEIHGTVYVGFATIATQSVIRSYTEIGRYCRIGRHTIIGTDICNGTLPSYSPFFDNTAVLFSQQMAKTEPKRRVIIGNDCAIGDNVTIANGVTIGDGAIILPNTYVEHDVAPYSIVSPYDRTPKFRFEKETIKKLHALSWWDADPNFVACASNKEIRDFIEFVQGNAEIYNYFTPCHIAISSGQA